MSNSVFVFLPGIHTARTVVILVNITNILLKRVNSHPDSSKVDWSLKCLSVKGLTIQGLTFKNTGLNKTILALFLSNNILLTDLFFQGSKLGARATVLNCFITVFKIVHLGITED